MEKLIFPTGSLIKWRAGGVEMSGEVLGVEGHQICVWPSDETMQLGIFAEHVLSADATPAKDLRND